jgi:cation/acetate symporter
VLDLTATSINVLGGPGSVGGGWPGEILAQPAAWTVHKAFLVSVLVSYATPGSVPLGTSRTMVRLHAPEDLRATDPPTRGD